jgi:hypothetical protein
MSQEDIEQLASDNFEKAIGELDDAGIICLIDLCTTK